MSGSGVEGEPGAGFGGDDGRRAGESAAAAYRRITAEIGSVMGALREQDERRARVLEQRLGELDARMRQVGERAALTRFAVELQWEIALDELWGESWMTLRPYPQPDPHAEAANLDALDQEVERRLAALQAELRWNPFRR